MDTLYALMVAFLLANIALGLIRIARGPTTADRLLAVQLFGTTGTAALMVLAIANRNDSFLTVALTFALLASILGITFTRYARPTEGDPL